MNIVQDSGNSRLALRLRQSDLLSMFRATVADRGEMIAVRDSNERMKLTYDQLWALTRRVAAGLAGLGLGRGDTLAIMLTNRPEFYPVDLAALFLGAIPFSLYNSAPASQLLHVLSDAACRIAVCEREFLPAITEARRLGVPLDRIIVIDGDGTDGEVTFDQLTCAVDPPFDFDSTAPVRPDDVATLIYTSGSTGLPKGVELTHANLVAEIRAIDAAVPQREDGSWISVLPAAHIGDRARAYYGALVAFGHMVTTVADPADLFATMRAVRPIYFGNPPRTWEKMRAAIETRHGVDVADRAARDPAFAAQVRTELGLDRSVWNSTGSAPTQGGQFAFFDALGIRLCELWGMTETCSMATTNTPDHCRFGSVGRALPGVELRLAEDGELLARGPTVAARYLNRPDANADAIDHDGWFRTGDLASVDSDGFWWITGRKKEIIINAAGKNMSPGIIESALKEAGSVIMQACVIGDRRPYNVALIVVDEGFASSSDAELRQRVQKAVDEANGRLSRVEQIKRFAMLRDEWLAGGDELTATMKLKRGEIQAKYTALIDDLYS